MCQDAFGGQEKIPRYDVASGIFGEPPKRDAEIYPLRKELIHHETLRIIITNLLL